MADNSNNRNQGNTSNRGFASMDEDKQREIASKGGQSQGKENNPANFANDRQKASEAGRKGGQARGQNQTGQQGQGEQASDI
jgi:general stress protein YciG